MIHTDDGPIVDAVPISIDEANKSTRQLILDLMELVGDAKSTTGRQHLEAEK